MQKSLLYASLPGLWPASSTAGRYSALHGQTSTQVEQPAGQLAVLMVSSPSKTFSTLAASLGQMTWHQVQVTQSSVLMATLPESLGSSMILRSILIASSGQISTQTLQASHFFSSNLTSPILLTVRGVGSLYVILNASQAS